jgi:hypothetical protein
MMNYLWRAGIAALFVVAFFYILPLFLDVVFESASLDGSLMALLRALVGFGAIAYVIWGPQKWPWAPAS